MVNAETVLTRQLITKWHERAHIDYTDLYVKEYIAYNAWFRRVTQCHEDYEAIKRLLKRFVIWDDYLNGQVLTSLRPLVEHISDVTHMTPVQSPTTLWDGVVKDAQDWQGLIYFWYGIRCHLFHGHIMPGRSPYDMSIRLAYESLHIFMNEIMKRMRYCFDDSDFTHLTEVQILLKSQQGAASELRNIEARLYQKFIHSPDIWAVDMVRT